MANLHPASSRTWRRLLVSGLILLHPLAWAGIGPFVTATPQGVAAAADGRTDTVEPAVIDGGDAADDAAPEIDGAVSEGGSDEEDPEGHVRFIPRGFRSPREDFGGFAGGGDSESLCHEGVCVRIGAAEVARIREASAGVQERLHGLRSAREELGERIRAAEAEYDALVEPALGEEYWASRIRTAAAALDEGRRMRALRAVADECLRSISAAETVCVWEGVARRVRGEEISDLERRGRIERIGGHAFHGEPLDCSPAAAARVTAIVLDPPTIAGPGGGKLCGGFHPDLALDYGEVTVLVCFGCRDLRLLSLDSSVTFDITDRSLAEFERFARRWFRNRDFEPVGESADPAP